VGPHEGALEIGSRVVSAGPVNRPANTRVPETADWSHCATASAEEGTQNAVPSSDSIPASPCPPAFLPIGTRVPTFALALGSRWLRGADRWGALVLSIGKARSIVVTEPIQLRSDFTRLRALPPNTLTSSYNFRHSNKRAQTKPNSLGHRFSGTAFGWSSFLTFVSRRSLELWSAPTVNPACAALRGAYPKIAPCSLPRPQAPLRSGD
jgi:hypothetical protein